MSSELPDPEISIGEISRDGKLELKFNQELLVPPFKAN